jgi:hypothetical protein
VVYINNLQSLLECILQERVQVSEVVEDFELKLALKFLNTPFIGNRLLGLHILISKVNNINDSNFPCKWKRI